MADNMNSDRVLLKGTVSFPNLFSPNDFGKYEVDLIFDKGSKTYNMLKKLEKEAIEARWGSVTKAPRGLVRLVREGDSRISKDGEVYDGYEGRFYARAKTGRRPQVTDVLNNEVVDPMEIQGGDECVILAHVYPYKADKPVHKDSILLTLHGVRKLKDGDVRFGGSPVDAADELSKYDDFEDDDKRDDEWW